MPACPVCSITCGFKKTLYRHMRSQHNIDPQLCGKVTCPLKCPRTFRSHKELRRHLRTSHEITIETETREFADRETFNMWRIQLEDTTGFGYTCRSSEKALKTGESLRSYYICHRSGAFKSHSTGQRKAKKAGSNKIGTTCPSTMEVSRSLIDGRVKVIFWKTHIGHDANVEMLTFRKEKYVRISDMVTENVCVVIPAAGIGERMGMNMPKQYIPIHQKPIICYTVEAFLRLPFIKKVIVVAASESLDLMLQTLSQMCSLEGEKLIITEGCGSRHQSIKAGLAALKTCTLKPDIVIVHDGVRPFFPRDAVCNIVKAAKQHGAAGVTCPLVSTVISVDKDGFLDSSLDRSKFRASEMPQAFQYDVICKTYEESSEHDLQHGTECLQLVQKYANVRAKLLPGDSHLWKVTHRKDIHACAAVVKENQNVAISNNQRASDILPFLKNSLSKAFKSVQMIGKFNESLLDKFPNVVQIHNYKKPYKPLEQLSLFTSGQKLTQLSSIVHILYDFDPQINFLEFHRQAKLIAKKLKPFNILMYFILWKKAESNEEFEEVADLVRSLLFDSNPNISGNVILT